MMICRLEFFVNFREFEHQLKNNTNTSIYNNGDFQARILSTLDSLSMNENSYNTDDFQAK